LHPRIPRRMAVVNSDKKKLLVIIAGPTAVGKTAFAINLAKHFQIPIISFDSRQFYREMKIGTAKPTVSELQEAEHHFVDNLSIHDRYTSGLFETDALKKLNELFQKHEIVIAVGGSGLYINALCYGIDDIPTNESVRLQLIERWKNEGLEKLQQEVLEIDPEFYQSSDMQNPRRVIRALEVFEVSGKPYSFYRKNQNKERPFETSWFGLDLERELLFERINKRVDDMLEAGLFEEVAELNKFKDLKALKTVGYQEFFEHLEGKHTFDRAVELVKRNSRVFAKKQLVWFKRNSEITWIKPQNTDLAIDLINQKIIK
jgi:tRNA dimethylallyltransferase